MPGLVLLAGTWMLDKLQIWVCRTVRQTLAASLKTLGHRRNVVSLSLFYRHYFGRCSSEVHSECTNKV